MANRPLLQPFPVLTNGNMTGSITSAVTIIQTISMPCYSLSWTSSSIVGAVSVELSNDYALNPDGSVRTAGTWNTVSLQFNGSSVTSIPINVDNSSGMIDLAFTGAYAARLVYAPTSGTGTLQALICGKVS